MDTLYYDSALVLGYMKLLLLFTGSPPRTCSSVRCLLIFLLISFH